MKKTLLATTALAFVAATAGAVDVELYGQVNKGLFAVNDGESTDFSVVDNALSSTRFGFKGAQALDNGLTASVLFEGEMASNSSDVITQNNFTGSTNSTASTAGSSPSFTERQARVGLSGNFGGLYIGQQSTAIDGVYTQDLAGAQDVMSADLADMGGAYQFRNSTTKASTGRSVASLTTSIDSSRADSVRYDSPIFAGFQGRVSAAQGGDAEVAALYDGAYGDFKVKGALGYRMENDGTGNGTTPATANKITDSTVASASVAHSSGLAGTLAYTSSSYDNLASTLDEPSAMYAKVGYSWDAFEVAADYGQSEEYALTAADNELTAMGLGAQYNLGNGVSAAALYRNYDADVTGTSTESIDIYGVNMRVKF